MAHRDEFPKSVKLAAWDRCGGRCECGCGFKIIGTPHYDHYPIPASLDGPGTLDNCRVLDRKHHKQISDKKDIPAIAKSTRVFEKRIGARPARGRGFRKPPANYDPWTRRMRDEA